MWHRYRLNFCAGLQVFVGACNLYLLYKIYGAGKESELFLISFSIFTAIELLYLTICEQYIFSYLELKASNNKKAAIFSSNFFTITSILGLAVYFFIYFYIDLVLKIFLPGFNNSEILEVKEFCSVLFLSLLFVMPNNIFQAYLNANENIGLSYIIQAFPNIMMMF